MSGLRRLCVFCGSRLGKRPAFAAAARELGTLLARRGVGLVYGGARVGLMGAVADAVLAAGGEAVGVLPTFMADRELAHPGLTQLHLVGSMHERKARMAELADAFVAIPGGIGTFEELFEVWTWGYIGLHRKPIGLLEVGGFYAPLVRFLERVEGEGFLSPEARGGLCYDDDPARLLAALEAALPPPDASAVDVAHT